MRYICCCTDITIEQWNSLMKGATRCSYRKLVRMVKSQLPDLYRELALEFYNPYSDQCKQTKTHYILVHSAIEYFIEK